jgi:hypothetical protein
LINSRYSLFGTLTVYKLSISIVTNNKEKNKMKINLIEHGGKHYVFHNTRNENQQMFIDRTWFIVKNLASIPDYDYLENLSYIWVNNKYHNVMYPNEVMEVLSKCQSIYTTV